MSLITCTGMDLASLASAENIFVISNILLMALIMQFPIHMLDHRNLLYSFFLFCFILSECQEWNHIYTQFL